MFLFQFILFKFFVLLPEVDPTGIRKVNKHNKNLNSLN